MDCNARALGELLECQFFGLAKLEQTPNPGGVVTVCGHDHQRAALAAGVQVGVTRRLLKCNALCARPPCRRTTLPRSILHYISRLGDARSGFLRAPGPLRRRHTAPKLALLKTIGLLAK
jgi:hypothetical protein